MEDTAICENTESTFIEKLGAKVNRLEATRKFSEEVLSKLKNKIDSGPVEDSCGLTDASKRSFSDLQTVDQGFDVELDALNNVLDSINNYVAKL